MCVQDTASRPGLSPSYTSSASAKKKRRENETANGGEFYLSLTLLLKLRWPPEKEGTEASRSGGVDEGGSVRTKTLLPRFDRENGEKIESYKTAARKEEEKPIGNFTIPSFLSRLGGHFSGAVSKAPSRLKLWRFYRCLAWKKSNHSNFGHPSMPGLLTLGVTWECTTSWPISTLRLEPPCLCRHPYDVISFLSSGYTSSFQARPRLVYFYEYKSAKR